MLTSVVIPLKSNTKYQCNELKYALRSLEKHLSNVGDVFIVTDVLPEWLTNVKHIFGKDYTGQRLKEFNISSKFCSACLDERVSNPFLATNDDVYLLTDYDASTFPFFFYGLIEDRMKQRKQSDIYYRACNNTNQALLKAHRNTFYYDLHVPILYDKEQFTRIVKALNWKKAIGGYVLKSLYSNMLSIEGVSYPDLKLSVPFDPLQIVGRPWFSNSNLVLKAGLFDELERLFPNPSKYEKPHNLM